MSAARHPPGPTPVPARMARQRAAIGCSDKIVADLDAVLRGVGDLDDRAGVLAVTVALREIGEEPGMLRRPFRRGHDAHHGPVYLTHIGIRTVDDRNLVGVEDDAR